MDFLRRTRGNRFDNRKPGWRLHLPVFPLWKRGYSPLTDEVLQGWWAAMLGVAVELIAVGQAETVVGLSVRLTWGVSPTRWTRHVMAGA